MPAPRAGSSMVPTMSFSSGTARAIWLPANERRHRASVPRGAPARGSGAPVGAGEGDAYRLAAGNGPLGLGQKVRIMMVRGALAGEAQGLEELDLALEQDAERPHDAGDDEVADQ